MNIRISKGHLGLHVIRGQRFHISAARQMSSRDEYRGFSPRLLNEANFFELAEKQTHRTKMLYVFYFLVLYLFVLHTE